MNNLRKTAMILVLAVTMLFQQTGLVSFAETQNASLASADTGMTVVVKTTDKDGNFVSSGFPSGMTGNIYFGKVGFKEESWGGTSYAEQDSNGQKTLINISNFASTTYDFNDPNCSSDYSVVYTLSTATDLQNNKDKFVKSGGHNVYGGATYQLNTSVSGSTITIELQEYQPPTGPGRTTRDVLGPAAGFGIIANDCYFAGHLESNFAVGKLDAVAGQPQQGPKNTDNGGSNNKLGDSILGDLDSNVTNLEYYSNGQTGKGTFYTDGSLVPKLDSKLLRDHNLDTTFTTAELQAKVASMVSQAGNMSIKLKDEPNQIDIKDIVTQDNEQKYHIDIDTYDGGTYYINMTYAEYTKYFLGNADDMRIKIKDDGTQTIVLNVPGASVDLPQQFLINGTGTSTDSSDPTKNNALATRTMVFNYYEATTAGVKGKAAGVFLLPNATYDGSNSTCSGQIIANKIKSIGGQEWHFTLPTFPDAFPATLRIEKTFTGALTDDTLTGGSTFAVADTAGNTVGSYTIGSDFTEQSGTWVKEIEVTAGKAYKVTESGNSVTGYDVKVYDVTGTRTELTGGTDITSAIINDGETKTVKFENNYSATPGPTPTADIEISKVEINGTSEIADAQLKLVKGDDPDTTDANDLVEAWKTDGKGKHKISNLADGIYTLVETTAPDGYLKAEAITFEIKDGKVVNQTDNVIKMEDDIVKIYISKVEINKSAELAGANLKVVKGDDPDTTDANDLVDSWTSDGKSQHKIEKLADGTYTLVETGPPTGYEKAEAITFKIKDGKVVNTKDNVVKMEDKPEVKGEISISKVEVNGTTEIADAQLKLVKGDDPDTTDPKDLVDSWKTDGKGQHTISNLDDGEYTLVETTAPNGYLKAEAITFKIKDGKVVDQTNNVIKMEDDTVDIYISKVEVNGTKEIADAQLKLVKGDDPDTTDPKDLVESWKTDGKGMHKISKLADGKYTLVETSAPNGYLKAEAITFKIKDGKVVNTQDNVVKMEDAPVDVSISKVEINKSGEIADAHLKVVKGSNPDTTDKDDLVDEWTTDGKGLHTIKNLADGTYTLVETTAPDGYLKAEAITFDIKDGKVVGQTNNVVKMEDAPVKVTFSKTEVNGTSELPGAELKVVKGTDPNPADPKDVVDSWTSGKTAHVIEKLLDGKYTMVETRAPQGYKVTEHITFEIKDGKVVGNKENVVKMEDDLDTVPYSTDIVGRLPVEIQKYDINVASGATNLTTAQFGLYREVPGVGSEYVETIQYSNGRYYTDKINDEGTWTIKEIKAPSGYTLYNDSRDVKTLKVERKYIGAEYSQTQGKYVNRYELQLASASQVKSTTVVFKNQPKKTEVTVIKEWDDKNNLAGKRDKFEITLYANGEPVPGSTIKLTPKDDEHTWTNLPEYLNGEKVTYSVKETSVPKEYKSSSDNGNITVVNGKATIIDKYIGRLDGGDGDNKDKDSGKDSGKDNGTKGGVDTGDSSNMLGWMGAMMVSVAAIMGALLYRRRKNHR